MENRLCFRERLVLSHEISPIGLERIDSQERSRLPSEKPSYIAGRLRSIHLGSLLIPKFLDQSVEPPAWGTSIPLQLLKSERFSIGENRQVT